MTLSTTVLWSSLDVTKGDIEVLADARRALKNQKEDGSAVHVQYDKCGKNIYTA